jgi:hypothetical protein
MISKPVKTLTQIVLASFVLVSAVACTPGYEAREGVEEREVEREGVIGREGVEEREVEVEREEVEEREVEERD